MEKVRILHISTAHPYQDPRVAYRVIPSLATHYNLIAALPHAPTGRSKGVHYVWLPKFRKLLFRVFFSQPLAFGYALYLRPKLLHLYDPELIPLARLIQLILRIPVVYEVHENFYKKLDTKATNQGSWAIWPFRWADRLARRQFYLVFTEHGYLDTYTNLQNPYCIIYNFPQLSFLDQFRKVYLPNSIAPEFFYIGQISLERAFDTLIAGLALLKTKYPGFIMHLFGESQLLKGELDQLPGYECVRDNLRFYGYTDQKKAFQYIGNVTAGLALLKPVGDYTESYPTKLFEYMALGLPIVTSNFRLYKDVVERHNCGFCISPHDPVQVAQVLIELIENPQKAFMMGLNGRQAVEHEYNWSSELEKLLNYYTLILGKRI